MKNENIYAIVFLGSKFFLDKDLSFSYKRDGLIFRKYTTLKTPDVKWLCIRMQYRNYYGKNE